MGIEMMAVFARLQLALLPVNPTEGGSVDGDWEEVVKRLPELVTLCINLTPAEYQERLIEAVRCRVREQ